jgi:hypothetical protein
MNELKFNSQVCTTKEQSQRLLDLGLKPETADCQYAALVIDWKGNPISSPKWRFYDHNKGFIVQNFEHIERVPAWSLHRLFEMICNKECEEYYYFDFSIDYDSMADVYNSIIEVIERHIKENRFNKKYLK